MVLSFSWRKFIFRASWFHYKKINKHCIVTRSFHSSKILFVVKVMANTWNIFFFSEHINNIHDIFLHGALNLKTCYSLCNLDRLFIIKKERKNTHEETNELVWSGRKSRLFTKWLSCFVVFDTVIQTAQCPL